jgi:hypothetical protein
MIGGLSDRENGKHRALERRGDTERGRKGETAKARQNGEERGV